MAVVELVAEAREQLAALPGPIIGRVERLLRRLERWPEVSGAKPLRGSLAGQYRLRTGDYRVQLRVERTGDDWLVTVLKIGHRDGFYGDED